MLVGSPERPFYREIIAVWAQPPIKCWADRQSSRGVWSLMAHSNVISRPSSTIGLYLARRHWGYRAGYYQLVQCRTVAQCHPILWKYFSPEKYKILVNVSFALRPGLLAGSPAGSSSYSSLLSQLWSMSVEHLREIKTLLSPSLWLSLIVNNIRPPSMWLSGYTTDPAERNIFPSFTR